MKKKQNEEKKERVMGQTERKRRDRGERGGRQQLVGSPNKAGPSARAKKGRT